MANITALRMGQINQDGGTAAKDTALFLKVFAGEVLAAYMRQNIMLDKHLVRNISSGKSAQFPVTGKVSAAYHTPGYELTGQNTNQNEIVISIDSLLTSSVFLADIDEAMSHFEVRSIYSGQMGLKLANIMDQNVIIEALKGAAAAATLTDGNGGTQISNDKFKISAGGAADVAEQSVALAAGIFAAAQSLDEKEIPDTQERYCILRPAEYYALVQNTDVINKLWGGNGAYSDGKVFRLAGIQMLKSNQLPKYDTTKTGIDTAGGTTYNTVNPEYNAYHNRDCQKTVGLVFTSEAVGTVKLMDLSLQSEYEIRRQGTLLVARYAVGHGYLRPECSVELKLDQLNNTAYTFGTYSA